MFHSSVSQQATGASHSASSDTQIWQGGFPCDGCGTSCGVLAAESGTFTDGSGSNFYGNNANCRWLIAPSAGASKITIEFTNVFIDEDSDYVRVYQCADASCDSKQSLGVLTGFYLMKQTFIATTGYLLVLFTSDDMLTSDGFTATWTSVAPTPVSFVTFVQHHGSLACITTYSMLHNLLYASQLTLCFTTYSMLAGKLCMHWVCEHVWSAYRNCRHHNRWVWVSKLRKQRPVHLDYCPARGQTDNPSYV
jgi:hypothetical protein